MRPGREGQLEIIPSSFSYCSFDTTEGKQNFVNEFIPNKHK